MKRFLCRGVMSQLGLRRLIWIHIKSENIKTEYKVRELRVLLFKVEMSKLGYWLWEWN